jgi:Domain of unknown function (DUF4265)
VNVSEPNIKIIFKLEQDQDGYPPAGSESLWAAPLGADRYRIDNIPFYVRGLATDDVVSAKKNAVGELIFEEVVERSKHSTVRVFAKNSADKETLRSELKQLGCDSEGSNIPRLFTVDIPPSVAYADIEKVLIRWEQDGRAEYEEGCIYS